MNTVLPSIQSKPTATSPHQKEGKTPINLVIKSMKGEMGRVKKPKEINLDTFQTKSPQNNQRRKFLKKRPR